MHVLAWIAVGLVAGFIARWVVRDDRSGCIYTIVVGVLGALVGGALMKASGLREGNEFRLSLVTATLGAILLLLVLQAIGGRGGRRSRRR
ncbi:MAG: GlsB/YeaQ/YmgE family stress response membrane protein [Actinobacteria bacterium]|nr:GlsB/YeaQ/YmgE family stress response membrane protein [Actinomycetota bacterium]